jgi:hypothetical protein
MNDDTELDPRWFTFARERPSEQDAATLIALLTHAEWRVRWNAARELYQRKDARARDALIEVLTHDPNASVRHMASRALGALHAAGIRIPIYPKRGDTSEKTRIRIALARLKELGVEVGKQGGYCRLLIPHELRAPQYLEIGYLMAQLNAIPFPDNL